MPTQNVNLTDHQSQFIRKCVESGRFQNASEVVRDALRMLEQEEAENEAKLESLRAEVQKGIDDVAEGRFVTLENEKQVRAFRTEIRNEARERLGLNAREQPASTDKTGAE